MSLKRITIKAFLITGAGALAFVTMPVGPNGFGGDLGGITKAFAQQGQGQGQGGGQGRGQGGGAGGRGGGGQGAVPQAAGGGGGRPDEPGGTGGGSTTVKLGRLNMAKAYLSPGFDPAKIDDPDAPLANLDLYKTSLENGATGDDFETLAGYLARVATAEISGASVVEVNHLLGVTDQFISTGIDTDAFAARINELVKENREEGEE